MPDLPSINIPDPLSTDALAQDVKQLDFVPKNEANVGLTVVNGDFGVEGQIEKDIGKQGEVAAEGSWLKRAGWALVAKIGWKWGG